jgi:tetratricopeptide (TPR) repeat protein
LSAVAQAALMQRDGASALRNAQRAAAECPNRSEAWLATAAAYAARDESAGVQRVYRDAINTNPQDLLLTQAYGNWLMEEGRQREALAVARSFTRKSPALLRGWSYYHSLCVRSDAGCATDPERGIADARTRYGVDLEVGKLPSNGLFGRLARR